MDPKYIAGSLKRESSKVLLKEFNKKFLPGSLAEHPIHHLVHSDLAKGAGDLCCLTCSDLLRLLRLAAK